MAVDEEVFRGFPTVPPLSLLSSRPAPTSTPNSAAPMPKLHCIGPPAATTSPFWTRCLTPAPISRRPGAVIGGGTPLADARAFGQWQAAHRLVERGARTTIVDAATLGLQDRLETFFASTPPSQAEINHAFWGACHGGQQQCAEYLLDQRAELNWVPPWENLTPLDAAQRSDAGELVRWLRDRGGMSFRGLS